MPVVTELLQRVLPGTSRAICDVREEVFEFALNPLAKTLQIEGPVGAGKSTLARCVGMVRRIAPLIEIHAKAYLEVLRFDEAGRIDLKLMPWYVELSLTGLAENLAEAQLFGSVKGSFTGAIDRRGIFEQAMTGRMRSGREDPGALLTNGVVFLDEIGDLSTAHQAKLLPILSGGVFYRLGDEGNQDRELKYNGTTIAASWHPLAEVLRADLYSRISANRIRMPALMDRMEDFELILDQLQEMALIAAKREIDRMIQVEQRYLDRAHWESRRDELGSLTQFDRKLLSETDWSARGNMRGLANAVQRILLGGRSAKEVIAGLSEASEPKDSAAGQPTLLDRLLSRSPDGQGLAGHLRAIEVEQRSELREQLLSNYDARDQVADALKIDKAAVSQQLHQMDRRRTRGREKEGK